jgi:hypothetical protein
MPPAVGVPGSFAVEDQHHLVVGVAVLGRPAGRDLADELRRCRAVGAGEQGAIGLRPRKYGRQT